MSYFYIRLSYQFNLNYLNDKFSSDFLFVENFKLLNKKSKTNFFLINQKMNLTKLFFENLYINLQFYDDFNLILTENCDYLLDLTQDFSEEDLNREYSFNLHKPLWLNLIIIICIF